LAEALILDSEALNALANPTGRGSLSVRARAIAQVAHERGALVRVPAPVLAEVCRGSRFDAAVNLFLNHGAVAVADLTREIAQRAGALLTRTRMSSVNAIDAFVVATALEFDSAVIASGGAAALARLAAPYRQISLLRV
jgi:hypothetical protein